jgi:hypothetical protein
MCLRICGAGLRNFCPSFSNGVTGKGFFKTARGVPRAVFLPAFAQNLHNKGRW